MTIVFADASYWIAIHNPKDPLHQVAIRISASTSIHHIFTSEMVLTEVFNYYAESGAAMRRAVAEAVDEIQMDAGVTVEPQTSRNFQEAMALYRRRLDKGWSITDCSSLLYTQKHRIREVLTHDLHFRQMGLKILMRDE